jgi:hypothetical protein
MTGFQGGLWTIGLGMALGAILWACYQDSGPHTGAANAQGAPGSGHRHRQARRDRRALAQSLAGHEKARDRLRAAHRDRGRGALAQAQGASDHTWRAYLSTQATATAPAVNARDRIGGGPWYNANGDLIAQNLDLLGYRLLISFSTDHEGNIANLAAPFEPLVKDIVFTRLPAGDCTNPAFRQHCTGTFSHGGTTVVVGQDRDGQLTLTVGSQPTYKLRPYQSRTFVIDELEGFRAEFHLGSDGEVDELILHQPNGTFLARRA